MNSKTCKILASFEFLLKQVSLDGHVYYHQSEIRLIRVEEIFCRNKLLEKIALKLRCSYNTDGFRNKQIYLTTLTKLEFSLT